MKLKRIYGYPASDCLSVANRSERMPEGVNATENVLEAGGFYVSRFELGAENKKYVSKKGVQPVTRTQNVAVATVKTSFIDTSYAKCALLNETCYDIVMSFVDGKMTKGRSNI